MFRDQYHPAVKKDLKKIDIQTRKQIQNEWLPILLQDPYQGQELAGPLIGLRSFHLKVKTSITVSGLMYHLDICE